MHLQPQVTFLNFPHSEATATRVYNKINNLDKFYDEIMHCDVVLEQEQRHHHQGKRYDVRILLTVPGKELTVNHQRDEDVYVAIRDAFNAARRQLLEYKRQKHNGTKKKHPLTVHGYISRIYTSRGYGFIASDGNDYYFTLSNISHPGFANLEVGMEVQFIPEMADEGYQAHRVTAGKHHSSLLEQGIDVE